METWNARAAELWRSSGGVGAQDCIELLSQSTSNDLAKLKLKTITGEGFLPYATIDNRNRRRVSPFSFLSSDRLITFQAGDRRSEVDRSREDEEERSLSRKTKKKGPCPDASLSLSSPCPDASLSVSPSFHLGKLKTKKKEVGGCFLRFGGEKREERREKEERGAADWFHS